MPTFWTLMKDCTRYAEFEEATYYKALIISFGEEISKLIPECTENHDGIVLNTVIRAIQSANEKMEEKG